MRLNLLRSHRQMCALFIGLHNQFQMYYSPVFLPDFNVLLPEKEKHPELSIARSLTLQHESSLEDYRGQSLPHVLTT